MKPGKKVLIAISAVDPGLLLIGYNIGSGRVTTMAKTDAHQNMSSFWVRITFVAASKLKMNILD